MEKILIGLTSELVIVGTFAAIIVPLNIAISNVVGKNIYLIPTNSLITMMMQTATTDTTTTVTTSTTSTTTSFTSTTTSTTPRLPISLLSTVTASNYYSSAGSATSQQDSLVDRTTGGGGLSTGAYAPQYIQLEFSNLYNISYIYLHIDQAPNGVTRHELNVGSNLSHLSLATVMNNYTSNGQWINLTYSPVLINIRFLRLNTISSPSWIQWIKFIVYDQ